MISRVIHHAARRETVVVKFGGEIAGDQALLRSICADIKACTQAGIRLIVVHGGGKQATELSARLGVPTTIVAGRRVTDEATVEVIKMAFAGTLNTDVVAACRAAGVRAIGISGVDSGLVAVVRRPPRFVFDPETSDFKQVDYGFVGDVVGIDVSVANDLLDGGFVPVVAPLASDEHGIVYNVNADEIAAGIAGALRASRLVVASNISGVRDANGQVIARIDRDDADGLIRNGIVTDGMIPKLEAALAAVNSGVACVRVIDGTIPGLLRREVLNGTGHGTSVVAVAKQA